MGILMIFSISFSETSLNRDLFAKDFSDLSYMGWEFFPNFNNT